MADGARRALHAVIAGGPHRAHAVAWRGTNDAAHRHDPRAEHGMAVAIVVRDVRLHPGGAAAGVVILDVVARRTAVAAGLIVLYGNMAGRKQIR